MLVFNDPREINLNKSQQEGAHTRHYQLIDVQLMKMIADSASDERGIMSINELTSALSTFDAFTLRRQILKLEGKGLVKKSEHGLILTEKGKERLQRFLSTKEW